MGLPRTAHAGNRANPLRRACASDEAAGPAELVTGVPARRFAEEQPARIDLYRARVDSRDVKGLVAGPGSRVRRFARRRGVDGTEHSNLLGGLPIVERETRARPRAAPRAHRGPEGERIECP